MVDLRSLRSVRLRQHEDVAAFKLEGTCQNLCAAILVTPPATDRCITPSITELCPGEAPFHP